MDAPCINATFALGFPPPPGSGSPAGEGGDPQTGGSGGDGPFDNGGVGGNGQVDFGGLGGPGGATNKGAQWLNSPLQMDAGRGGSGCCESIGRGVAGGGGGGGAANATILGGVSGSGGGGGSAARISSRACRLAPTTYQKNPLGGPVGNSCSFTPELCPRVQGFVRLVFFEESDC